MSRQSPVDDEFVDFVRARQHDLRRTAYLLCGDLQRADAAVAAAFGELRRRWRRIEDEQPDVVVRRALFRRVPAAPSAWAGPDELADLFPRERAVAVFRRFEERPEPEVAAVLGTSVASVRHHDKPVSRDALLDAAAEVGERDFVDLAGQQATIQRRRSRRRVLTALGATVAAAVVLTVVNNNGAEHHALPAPRPVPSPPDRSVSDPAEWNSAKHDVFGVEGQLGPSRFEVAHLPAVDDLTRRQLALPESLDLPAEVPTLTSVGANSAPVRVVLLRRAGTAWQPVLYRPTLSRAPYTVVDDLTLTATVDERGTVAEPLTVRAIADDRRHVLFVQPNKAVVLDVFSGESQSFEVPDRYLSGGGWAPDGQSAIVSSRGQQWRVDPDGGRVRRISLAYPDPRQVWVEPPDGMRILEFGPDGSTAATRTGPRVLSGTIGDTVSGDGGGFATGGTLSDAALWQLSGWKKEGAPPYQAVFASAGAAPGFGRLLVVPPDQDPECCPVLGWIYADDVLVRWGGSDLLAWNTRTGGLSRVSTLPSSSTDRSGERTLASVVAIAP